MKALVTGGAGFIGSHIARRLLADGCSVRVLDDLSSGDAGNLPADVELLTGDVADAAVVAKAMADVEVVFHQAARRAVLWSVEHPLETDTTNTHGTLTVLKAAADAGARRVVHASSSSVYGGAAQVPTPESAPLLPRSPYAVSKLAAEHYCRVFAEMFELETVALRYFNVYGPRQRPDSAYAAVIPLFIDALRRGEPATIHGDGLQSRDFTYVDDVVAANMAAVSAPAERCSGQAFNVAGGREVSLLDVLGLLGEIIGVEPAREHHQPRRGDVRHSCADAGAASRQLGHRSTTSLEEGLRRTVAWFSTAGG